VEAGHPPFTERERDYADFTYIDSEWTLTKLLSETEFKITDTWPRSSKPPTYHLEVKSTTEKCEEPFYMSNNQVEKVCPSPRITKCAMYADGHRLVLINCKVPMQHRLMSM
jgi:hypothetical protein